MGVSQSNENVSVLFVDIGGSDLQLLLIIYVSLNRYTKPKGQLPDYSAPVILRLNNRTVEDFCNSIHKTIVKEFK